MRSTPFRPRMQGSERLTLSRPYCPVSGVERGIIFLLSRIMVSTIWVTALAMP